jgi:thioredoxin-related protein
MKKIALLICLPVFLISGELVTALLKAKKENKPVMVYVKSETCQFCEKMKSNTLESSLIQNNMQGFIFVTADKKSAEAQKYLPATRYTPTIYFISYQDSKFKAVNVVKGYLGKDDFNLWIEDTKRKLGMSNTEEKIPETFGLTNNDTWMYDIASGMDYASQTGKQLMVYVDEADSKWSKKMLNETLEKGSIKDALNDFVLVKIPKGSTEAKAYGLNPNLTPSVYFMKSDGTPLATAEGFFGADDFLLWINHAKKQLLKK